MALLKHVLSVEDLGPDMIFNFILPGCQEYIGIARRRLQQDHFRGGKLQLSFLEPSTRTFNSYMQAGQLLQLNIAAEQNAQVTSSLAKGESLSDTVCMYAVYGADIIVLRTKLEGAPAYAAEQLEKNGFKCAVHNAGDGSHEHPTQALLDLLTILLETRRLDNLKIGFLGDLKYSRTVHSLLKALSYRENISIVLVSPVETRLPDEYRCNFSSCEEGSDPSLLAGCHVVYVTRIQEERFGGDELGFRRTLGKNILTPDVIKKLLKTAIIMHPLPENGELKFVRDDPRLVIFKQALYGVAIRTFLLNESFRNRAISTSPCASCNIREQILQGPLPLSDYLRGRTELKGNDRYFSPVRHGVVIDHIPLGHGQVLRDLLSRQGILDESLVRHTLENVPSKRLGRKDVIVLADGMPPQAVLNLIASFVPSATFNLVNEGFFRKMTINNTNPIRGLGPCPNPCCVTNFEPDVNAGLIQSKFSFQHTDGLLCYYCGHLFKLNEIVK